MPYEQKSSMTFSYPVDKVFAAAINSVQHMGGKVVKKDEKNAKLIAQMDKKLFGNYLGDRSQLEIQFSPAQDDGTQIDIFAFPLNAVGQKLMFGARPGVLDTILRVLTRELEDRLSGKPPAESL